MPAVVAERTEYAPGTFSWIDVTTTDLDGAAAFYKGLLGWDHVDRPIGDGAVYRMFQLRGKNVAGGVEQQAEQRSHGIPPHWNNYVTVDSADDTAARVSELGGNLMMDPFDVFDAGRMAVFTDPTGAVLSVWEPRAQHRRGARQRPGLPHVERAFDDRRGPGRRASTPTFSDGATRTWAQTRRPTRRSATASG